jgi:hypothetical protein
MNLVCDGQGVEERVIDLRVQIGELKLKLIERRVQAERSWPRAQ